MGTALESHTSYTAVSVTQQCCSCDRRLLPPRLTQCRSSATSCGYYFALHDAAGHGGVSRGRAVRRSETKYCRVDVKRSAVKGGWAAGQDRLTRREIESESPPAQRIVVGWESAERKYGQSMK